MKVGTYFSIVSIVTKEKFSLGKWSELTGNPSEIFKLHEFLFDHRNQPLIIVGDNGETDEETYSMYKLNNLRKWESWLDEPGQTNILVRERATDYLHSMIGLLAKEEIENAMKDVLKWREERIQQDKAFIEERKRAMTEEMEDFDELYKEAFEI